ncbi:hypothetical protein AVEN_39777-1, partial [Araneus ventricosus]
ILKLINGLLEKLKRGKRGSLQDSLAFAIISVVIFSFPTRKESSTFHSNRKPQANYTWWSLRRHSRRNHPTVRIDHWGYESLAVGRPGVRLCSGVKGRRSSIPSDRNKKGGVGVGTRTAVNNRIRQARNSVSVSGSEKKLCDQL